MEIFRHEQRLSVVEKTFSASGHCDGYELRYLGRNMPNHTHMVVRVAVRSTSEKYSYGVQGVRV